MKGIKGYYNIRFTLFKKKIFSFYKYKTAVRLTIFGYHIILRYGIK